MILPLTVSLLLAPAPLAPSDPESGGSRFGRAVLALDDLDGDGVREIAVGAPTAREHRGVVLVLSGKTQEVLAVWEGPEERTTFGHTLRSIQDVDGDGTGDVLVGFEFWERTEIRSGKDGRLVHEIDRGWEEVIPFGDFDGDGAGDLLVTTAHLWEVRSGRTNTLLNGHSWVRSGGRFDPIGDVDGDGLVDGIYFGKEPLVMLSGRPAEGALDRLRLFDSKSRKLAKEQWPGLFGKGAQDGSEAPEPWRAAPAGDLDGDGRNDLVVAVRTKKNKSTALLGLSLQEPSKPLMKVLGARPTILDDAPIAYVTLGGVDLDGDDRDDVVFANQMGPITVCVKAAGAAKDASSPPTGAEGILWHSEWPDDWATSGVSLAGFEDADGDGTPDILVGESDWFWHGDVYRTGRLFLLSGRTGREVWSLEEQRYPQLVQPAAGSK